MPGGGRPWGWAGFGFRRLQHDRRWRRLEARGDARSELGCRAFSGRLEIAIKALQFRGGFLTAELPCDLIMRICLDRFNDIVLGDNKCSYEAFNDVGYAAGPGWDALHRAPVGSAERFKIS